MIEASRRLAVGPIAVELRLDAVLWTLAPARWGVAGPCRPPDLTVTLGADDALSDATPRQGFDRTGAFAASGCRLQRRRLATGTDEISGTLRGRPGALVRAVRFATQPTLLDRGWLLLHGATVLLANGVHLLVGRSGIGKSTLARRLEAAGGELLGDEVALIGEGRAAVHPGQFGSGLRATSSPLAAIHFLAQGEPRFQPIAKGEATALLLGHAMVYEDGAEAAQRALVCTAALVEAFPLFATRVPDDARAAAMFEPPARRAAPEATAC